MRVWVWVWVWCVGVGVGVGVDGGCGWGVGVGVGVLGPFPVFFIILIPFFSKRNKRMNKKAAKNVIVSLSLIPLFIVLYP